MALDIAALRRLAAEKAGKAKGRQPPEPDADDTAAGEPAKEPAKGPEKAPPPNPFAAAAAKARERLRK